MPIREYLSPLFSFRFAMIACIVLLAVCLRFYKLGEIPRGLNRDEASLGYTAYSLLQYGMDEHGVARPINIQSFGDWKLPLYVYTSVPVVAIFGLNEWSVRMPSALAGVAIVILGMMLTRLLIEKEKSPTLRYWLPLLTGFLLAVNPWAVHVSRVAYEANLSYAYLLLGVVLVLMGFQRKLSKERVLKKELVWVFPIVALCFGLTLFGYHSFQLFTPLVGITISLIWWKEIVDLFQRHKIVFFSSLLIVILFAGGVLAAKSGAANAVKFGGITPFAESRYREELFTKRQVVGEVHPFIAKLYANRLTIYATTLAHNALTLWNPTFLFISGGTHGSHSVLGIANFYLIEAIFILVGLWYFFRSQKRWQVFLGVWLAIASIAPIITIEPNHPIRFLPALFPLVFLSAFGLFNLIRICSKNLPSRALNLLMFVIIFYSVFQFVVLYFVVFPNRDLDRWPWYMKSITQSVTQIDSEVPVKMQGESSSPYIYYLFYHPELYQIFAGDLEYYPPTDEGFIHASRLKNLYFGEIDWTREASANEPSYYVLEKKELPSVVGEDVRFSIVQEWRDPYAKKEWYLIAFNPNVKRE